MKKILGMKTFFCVNKGIIRVKASISRENVIVEGKNKSKKNKKIAGSKYLKNKKC